MLISSSDILPFRMLATKPELCKGAMFVDVDYEKLILEKARIVNQAEQLRLLLDRIVESQDRDDFVLKSENYSAISCDLRDIDRLDRLIRGTFSADAMYLVICEVSLTYMDARAADAVIRWAATLGNGKDCLPNYHLPAFKIHMFHSSFPPPRAMSAERTRTSLRSHNAQPLRQAP